MIAVRIAPSLGVITGKEQGVWSDIYVLYLDLGGGYMGINIKIHCFIHSFQNYKILFLIKIIINNEGKFPFHHTQPISFSDRKHS